MQAVLEPCMVKMTSLEESNQYSSGARRIEDTIDRGTPGWLPCRSPDTSKRGVRMSRVLNLAPGYEPLLKSLFSAVRRQNS